MRGEVRIKTETTSASKRARDRYTLSGYHNSSRSSAPEDSTLFICIIFHLFTHSFIYLFIYFFLPFRYNYREYVYPIVNTVLCPLNGDLSHSDIN